MGTRLAAWFVERVRTAVQVDAPLAGKLDTPRPATLVSLLRSLTDSRLIFPGFLNALWLGDQPEEQPQSLLFQHDR